MEDAEICDVGGGGLILPIFGDDEQRWPKPLRVIIYAIGLLWCFMGVALVSDIFMGAIETITSKKKRKMNPTTMRPCTVLVWNPTVANLTLMALGSSAPEILLSVIELLGNKIFSGDLGPSTIVGSAAFNLLCITAICVSAIADKELRMIKEMPVYVVTSFFSLFAYLWLLIILLGFSKNVVEIWEGVLTFSFFPMFVFLAFMADRGYFSKTAPPAMGGHVVSADMPKEELARLEAQIRSEYKGKNLTDEQVAKHIECEHALRITRAKYRVAAVRDMTGSKRITIPTSKTSQPMNSVVPFEGAIDMQNDIALEHQQGDPVILLEFEAARYAVLESVGVKKLGIHRIGDDSVACSVGYKSRNGTAIGGEDYKPVEGRLEIPAGTSLVALEVEIIDDTCNEADEEFYVDLFQPASQGAKNVVLGECRSTTVVILDDDHPGIIDFRMKDDLLEVTEGLVDSTVDIHVFRVDGSTGTVGCKFHTEDGSAVAGANYVAASGALRFKPGVLSATIQVKIKAIGRYEDSDQFRVVLTEPTGGAKFDSRTDGGEESTILTVMIKSEQQAKARIDRIMSTLQVNWEKAKVGHANWRDQFREALYVNGGDDDGPSSAQDYAVHFVLLPWKLLFALIPPTDYLDGWACFCSSLGMIGAVTAIIGDTAGLLGCCMGVPDNITAITFVALGTSLPDTFASKAAAVQDPFADASIGNVTGSNAVNVFLGLGLPWTIGSVYWKCQGPNAEWLHRYKDKEWAKDWQDGAFVVEAGTLAFSVFIFIVCAVITMIVLYLRRRIVGGELGGPTVTKYATSAFLIFLWLIYIGLSSWSALTEGE